MTVTAPQRRRRSRLVDAMAVVKATIRLTVPAGKAKPSPAIGQALGSLGVNMMAFCKEFNERSKHFKEEIPCRVTLRARTDNTFNFDVLMPSSQWMLKQAAGVEKGAHSPGLEVAGKVHVKQLYEIAKLQAREPFSDLVPLQIITKNLAHSCKSMGLIVDHSHEDGTGADEVQALIASYKMMAGPAATAGKGGDKKVAPASKDAPAGKGGDKKAAPAGKDAKAAKPAAAAKK